MLNSLSTSDDLFGREILSSILHVFRYSVQYEKNTHPSALDSFGSFFIKYETSTQHIIHAIFEQSKLKSKSGNLWKVLRSSIHLRQVLLSIQYEDIRREESISLLNQKKQSSIPFLDSNSRKELNILIAKLPLPPKPLTWTDIFKRIFLIGFLFYVLFLSVFGAYTCPHDQDTEESDCYYKLQPDHLISIPSTMIRVQQRLSVPLTIAWTGLMQIYIVQEYINSNLSQEIHQILERLTSVIWFTKIQIDSHVVKNCVYIMNQIKKILFQFWERRGQGFWNRYIGHRAWYLVLHYHIKVMQRNIYMKLLLPISRGIEALVLLLIGDLTFVEKQEWNQWVIDQYDYMISNFIQGIQDGYGYLIKHSRIGQLYEERDRALQEDYEKYLSEKKTEGKLFNE